MSKLGRNDPCYCGSGKKYKKCHLRLVESRQTVSAVPDPDTLRQIFDHVRAQQEEQRALEEIGYYLPHIETEFKGRRMRAVGNGIYSRPLSETFHEFIIGLLRFTLGEEWFAEQGTLPEAQRHFIVTCYERFGAWRRKNATAENRNEGGWSGVPDGWSRSLLSLACDVYSLQHRGELPSRLVNRLKDRGQYQGARYEIAVAGMFVRLGCTIRFLDQSTSDPVPTHCEFIAKHQATGVEIGVEAKSRHRPGVIHFPGEVQADPLMKANVRDLLENAVSQAPRDMPFLIFIDVNVPIDETLTGAELPWMQDVRGMIQRQSDAFPDEPNPWNGIVFTNYAFHYATEREADTVQYVAVEAGKPLIALPSATFFGYLRTVLQHYGHVPHLK